MEQWLNATVANVKRKDDAITACCPAHDDSSPSLSVRPGKDRDIVLHCHAGCTPDAVMAALGHAWTELSDNRRADTEYHYRDANGDIAYTVVRKPGKKFLQKRIDRVTGEIVWNLNGVERLLYRLPEVLEALELGERIWIVEGEKDADRLHAEGVTATCNSGGATKFTPSMADYLKGADITIVMDKDDTGRKHADEVKALLAARDATITVVEALTGKDAYDHLANGHTVDQFVIIDAPPVATHSVIVSLDDLIDTPDEPYAWLVPGLIEVGDRIILTGLEGGGKSTLCRQIAAQVSIGVHPFGGDPFDPIRALIVDCENSKRQVRRKADILRKRSGALLDFVFRPDGIDLTVVEHVAWLEQVIKQARPQFVTIGPIYKMAGGDPKDEQTAKAVASAIDSLRVTYGFACLIEAHTPYADSGKSKRPVRPYGASLWSRWPEFGVYISKDGELEHWRGQRDEREWPKKLRRGNEWPWEVEIAAETEMASWDGPTHCMDKVSELLADNPTVEYSGYQLWTTLKALGEGYRRDTVTQAAERLAMNGAVTVRNGPRNARMFGHKSNPSQSHLDHEESWIDGPF